MLEAQRNFEEALRNYRDSPAIIEKLAKTNPDNRSQQRDLSISYENVGAVLKTLGRLAEALRAYGDSFAIMEQLAKADPDNADWQGDLASIYSFLASVQLKRGSIAEALTALRSGREIMARLVAIAPDNAKWTKYLLALDRQIVVDKELNRIKAASITSFQRTRRSHRSCCSMSRRRGSTA